MNIAQKGLLTLVKSAITGECYELPEEFALEAEDTIKLMKKHHLMALIYPGAVNCKIPSDNPAMKQLFLFYCKHMAYSEKQMLAFGRICQAFEEQGIDYLPTKGCNLKALYPKPEMRSMGDADITVRREQLEKIDELMPQLGYTPVERGVGTVVWDGPSLHLELHMHMNSFYNQNYYDDVWERVNKVSNHRYAFGVEDEFIHVFNHFARHYRVGGIGCRHLVDIYVLRRNRPQMNEKYIWQELKKIHLQKFYKNVLALLDVWFEDGEETPVTERMNEYILSSGNWGSIKSRVLAQQIKADEENEEKRNFRGRTIRERVIPDLKSMQERYPILEKVPFLLPLFWVVRWGKAIRIGRKMIPDYIRDWSFIKDEAVLEYRDKFRAVGLDLEGSREDE